MNTSEEKYFLNWDEAFNSKAAQVEAKHTTWPGFTGMVFKFL